MGFGSAVRLGILKLAVVLVATALPLAGFEILLRLGVVPLPEAAAQYTFGCYEPSQPRRYIHTASPALQLGLHRPNFQGDCYFLGYTWHHRADAYGWRNPVTWESADIVVLGDSMIYGHGVEEQQTTTHFLRELSGRTVVNMGITGACPVHYLAYLRNFALPLQPKVVVILYFGNDLTDIRATRPPEEVRRFVETGEAVEAQVLPRAELIRQLRLPGKQEPDLLDFLATYRFLQYKAREYEVHAYEPVTQEPATGPIDTSPGEQQPAVSPREEQIQEIARQYSLQIAYLRRAMAMMVESARAADVALVVGELGKRDLADELLRRLLRELSSEHGIHYFDTPDLMGRARLPRDGHLSETGHRQLAEALAAFLGRQGLL